METAHCVLTSGTTRADWIEIVSQTIISHEFVCCRSTVRLHRSYRFSMHPTVFLFIFMKYHLFYCCCLIIFFNIIIVCVWVSYTHMYSTTCLITHESLWAYLLKMDMLGIFILSKKKRTKQIRIFFIEKKITIVDVTIVSCIH